MNPNPFAREKEGRVRVAGFASMTKKRTRTLMQSIECLQEHIEYLMDLLGVDHVVAGLDTLYGVYTGLYRNAPIGEASIRAAKGNYARARLTESRAAVLVQRKTPVRFTSMTIFRARKCKLSEFN